MRLFKVFGITIELHKSFLWLAAILAIALLITSPGELIPTMGIFAILFASVLIHELFHSVTAISKGLSVKKIILLPIGGISVADDIPEKPSTEFWIAIAGPAFNFMMVFAIILLVKIFPILPWPAKLFEAELTSETLSQAITNYPLFALFWVNLMLGSFNLFIPALPLDGGRVLRSILAARTGNYAKATENTAKISGIIAMLLFALGFLSTDIIILVIAVFIYFGSS